MTGMFTTSTNDDHSSTLSAIESQGWRHEHADYVYRTTGASSRDKLLSSGQQESMSGEILGVYIFRATADPAGPEPG